MLTLFQPLLTALVGAALAVFGALHTVLQLPAAIVWHHVLSASPQLLVVMVFLGCVMIFVIGLTMLWTGIQATRIRMRQLRHVRWPSTAQPGYSDGGVAYDDHRW
jgi:hypothetical protein